MRLKELRIEKNCTQKQVADATGLTTMAVKNYEHNRRKPTYDALIALADYFNVSMDYIAERTNNPKINT